MIWVKIIGGSVLIASGVIFLSDYGNPISGGISMFLGIILAVPGIAFAAKGIKEYLNKN
jgi:hypothetical protein